METIHMHQIWPGSMNNLSYPVTPIINWASFIAGVNVAMYIHIYKTPGVYNVLLKTLQLHLHFCIIIHNNLNT